MVRRFRNCGLHFVGDRKQRLRRMERPSLEELETRTLLTVALSDIGVVGQFGNVAGLNAAVEVVGNFNPEDTDTGGYAFLLESSGAVDNLGNLPGYPQSTATGINGSGEVIGYSSTPGSNAGTGKPEDLGFLDVNGVMTSLGTLYSNSVLASEPVGVNDSGQVVGWS